MTDPSTLRVEAQIDTTAYRVLGARLRRRISAIDRAELELTDDAGGPEPGELLGKTLQISLQREDGSSTARFVGQVIAAEQVAGDGPLPFVRLVAAPWLWRLGRRRDCRVFQQATVRDIVTQVLEAAGGIRHDWRLEQSYQQRIYTVQHRESDLDFIARLLSEEGIWFVVEPGDSDAQVIFTDGDLGPIEGESCLPYRAAFGMDGSRDRVGQLSHAVAVCSDEVVLRDYDFERPDFELSGSKRSDQGAAGLAVYDFPARTTDPGVAEQRAAVLLASLGCQGERLRGLSQALHLLPGRRFTVEDHPYAPLNQEYLLVAVEHRYRAHHSAADSGRDDAHRCRFEAMPLAVAPYRPPRLPRARRIAGYQSAVVVGPGGSEIHPDEHGRVKAQPIWDRQGDGSDKASCFMRTTQPPLAGGLLSPRVGWEVTLQHLEGDPDRPLVTGRLYTAKAPPPYELPAHKTRSAIQTATSPGGGSSNELRFEDGKGAEEMFIGGSHDSSVSAANNATETVGGNETRTIGANQKLDVTGAVTATAGSQSWQVGGNQGVAVSTYMVDQNGGAHDLSIGGNRDLTVGGDHRRLCDGSSSLDVGGMQIDLVAGSVTDDTLSTFDDDIGAALVELAAGGRNVACTSRVEDVGAAKAVLASGGRGVEVGGSLTHDVAGAILIKTKGDWNDNSGGKLTSVAGGAQVIKASNVTFAAKSLLTIVCGGSTLTLTPASVTLAGASITLDGVAPQSAALIKEN